VLKTLIGQVESKLEDVRSRPDHSWPELSFLVLFRQWTWLFFGLPARDEQVKGTAAAGGDLPILAAIGDGNGVRGEGEAGNLQHFVVGGDIENLAPVAQSYLDAGEVLRQHRIEVQNVGPHFDAQVATLHQIDGAGHGAGVNALRRGAALNVADVAVEGGLEQMPGALAVGAG